MKSEPKGYMDGRTNAHVNPLGMFHKSLLTTVSRFSTSLHIGAGLGTRLAFAEKHELDLLRCEASIPA